MGCRVSTEEQRALAVWVFINAEMQLWTSEKALPSLCGSRGGNSTRSSRSIFTKITGWFPAKLYMTDERCNRSSNLNGQFKVQARVHAILPEATHTLCKTYDLNIANIHPYRTQQIANTLHRSWQHNEYLREQKKVGNLLWNWECKKKTDVEPCLH